MQGLRSLSSSTTATCPDPRPLHAAGHPFPIHSPAGGPQIRRHPGTSVIVPMPLMSRLQFHKQARILLPSSRWPLGLALPRILPTAGYPQHKTGPGYRRHVARLLNPGVPHRDSLTKYAAAVFTMSLSCVNCAFSVRNRVSSACTSVTSGSCPLRENGYPRRTRRTQ